MSAGQAGERINDHHDITTGERIRHSAFEASRRHSEMFFKGPIVGRGKDFGLYRTTKVSDLFWALIDEETVERRCRRAGGNAETQILEKRGLSRTGGSQDQGALSKADGAEQIEDAESQWSARAG
jgi:hypothetical protein